MSLIDESGARSIATWLQKPDEPVKTIEITGPEGKMEFKSKSTQEIATLKLLCMREGYSISVK